MKKLLITIGFMFMFSIPLLAQAPKCPTMPAGLLCITQEAGNVARSNAILVEAQKNKLAVQDAALKTKDEEIAAVKQTAADNAAKLTDQIHQTETKFAEVNGKLTECQNNYTKILPLVEFLAKNQRSKQQGLINIKLGGQ